MLVDTLAERGKTVGDLQKRLHDHQRTTIVYEIMKFDEHVYIDRGKDLYVHLVEKCPTSEMAATIGDLLPTVDLIAGPLKTVSEAIQVWEKDNKECTTELEGYILVIVQQHFELKVKLKFWRYLILREFREVLQQWCCPTIESVSQKCAMWGCPNAEGWAEKLQQWFWWSKLHVEEFKDKKYIAARDAFLAGNTDQVSARDVSKIHPVVVYIVFCGIQCSGKSTLREKLHARIGGFAASQDECGGDRGNLIKEIQKYCTAECTKAGFYPVIIDRCNLNWEQRRLLYQDLQKIEHIGCIDAINVESPSLETLFERFLKRTGHSSFSVEHLGALGGFEILAENIAKFQPSPDNIGVNVAYIDDNVHPKYTNYGKYPTKKIASKLIYTGIAVIINQSLKDLLPVPKDWIIYGTHITLEYGKDAKKVVDGEPTIVTIIGKSNPQTFMDFWRHLTRLKKFITLHLLRKSTQILQSQTRFSWKCSMALQRLVMLEN